MKKLLNILATVIITGNLFSQSPQKMSYQAVIRNSSNALITSTAVGMKISILQGSASGTSVYVETQTPSTNLNGLVSIEIGSGAVQSGTFAAISWSAGPYFIKTETDPLGGTAYSITGVSQLVSVPYALHAESSSSTPGLWMKNLSNVYYNGGNVGIGTNLPNQKLSVLGGNIAWGNTSESSFLKTDQGGSIELGGDNVSNPISNGVPYIDFHYGTGSVQDFNIRMQNAGNNRLDFTTNSSGLGNPVMTINGSNVGVGTIAPAHKLHVAGGIGSSVNNGHALFEIAGGVTGSPQLLLSANANVNGSAYQIQAVRSSLSADAPLALNPLGGNIGIGTTNPTIKLDVNGIIGQKSGIVGCYLMPVDASGLNTYKIGLGMNLSWNGSNWITTGDGVNNGATAILSAYANAASGQQYDAALKFYTIPSTGNTNQTLSENTLNGFEKMRITSIGNVGIGTTLPAYKLEVNGTAAKPGGGSWTATSDARLKKDVVPYTDGLNELLKIKPVRYHYNELSGNDTKPEYVGVIAQQLKEVAPYMVGSFKKEDVEYLNVDNSAMSYMLINAVKEQQQLIKQLQEEVNQLKVQVNKQK